MTAAPVPAPPAEVLGVPWPGRCLVMGILNVTPDSFSDGGDHLAPESAIARGLELMRDGADLVDVGGESTRPGAAPVPVDVELARVVPVVRALAEHGVPVSVDTTKAAVAAEAVAAGARVVNDVSGGLADETMVELVAALAVPYVVMHWRAPSAEMRRHARYGDVVAEVREELGRRLDAVTAAGVDPELIVLDPGLGFAKRPAHDWRLLACLDELATLGRPLLVGASRKSFLGAALACDGPAPPPRDRDAAGAAVAAMAAAAGAAPGGSSPPVLPKRSRGSSSRPNAPRPGASGRSGTSPTRPRRGWTPAWSHGRRRPTTRPSPGSPSAPIRSGSRPWGPAPLPGRCPRPGDRTGSPRSTGPTSSGCGSGSPPARCTSAT